MFEVAIIVGPRSVAAQSLRVAFGSTPLSTAIRAVPAGSSRSEGGFAEGRYAAASLLDQYEKKDSRGKNYYQYELMVRSADGNEGGRHHIIKATVRPDISNHSFCDWHKQCHRAHSVVLIASTGLSKGGRHQLSPPRCVAEVVHP